MTWKEHLAECKKHALACVDKGDLTDAVVTMAAEIQEHPENKMDETLLTFLITAATFDWHPEGIRRWINGFN